MPHLPQFDCMLVNSVVNIFILLTQVNLTLTLVSIGTSFIRYTRTSSSKIESGFLQNSQNFSLGVQDWMRAIHRQSLQNTHTCKETQIVKKLRWTQMNLPYQFLFLDSKHPSESWRLLYYYIFLIDYKLYRYSIKLCVIWSNQYMFFFTGRLWGW